MELAWRGIAAIARVAVWCGGAMLLSAALIVSAEVVARKGLGPLFGPGLVFSGSDEISAYLFAVGTSWSLAHALVTRGHVRIDALYSRFGPRNQVLLDLLALLGLGLFLAAMLERTWDLAFSSWMTELRSNTPLRIPLAWAQLPWFGGIALFGLALVLAVLRTLVALARGDYATAAATSGAITQNEEIESELESLGLSKETPGPGR